MPDTVVFFCLNCCHFHKYIPFIIFTVFHTFPTSFLTSKLRGICAFFKQCSYGSKQTYTCDPVSLQVTGLPTNCSIDWYFRREAKMGTFLTCSNSHIVGTTLTNSIVCSAGFPRSYSLWAKSRSMRRVPQLNLCEMNSLDRSHLDPGCRLLSPPYGSESNYTKAVDVLKKSVIFVSSPFPPVKARV